MSNKRYATKLDERIDSLAGPEPRTAGDRWPTHKAKWRAARRTKTAITKETIQ